MQRGKLPVQRATYRGTSEKVQVVFRSIAGIKTAWKGVWAMHLPSEYLWVLHFLEVVRFTMLAGEP